MLKNLKNKIHKKLIFIDLIKRYEKRLVVEEAMEGYLTSRILYYGEKGRRKELATKQKEIIEVNKMINYLKTL